MRRTLLYLLGVVVVAGLVGTLAAKDPGYVLISYDGNTMQTGLWVFLAGLFLLGFASLLMLKLWRFLFNSASNIQRWQKDRSLSKSIDHTSKGMLFLQEGNSERAEKFLVSGARNQPKPVVNYLGLARVANNQGKSEQREMYLRQALEADPKAATAVSILRAELALERSDYSGCIAALKDTSESSRTLLLKKSALLGESKFSELELLLPKLKKLLPEGDFARLEAEVVMAGINSQTATDEQRLAYYRNASEALKQDTAVIQTLCRNVAAEKELESIVKKAIKRSWQPALVEVYAELGTAQLDKRLKTALGWQKQHPVDPALQYCIGRLQQHLGQKQEAKQAYQIAVDKGGHKLASEHLASLYADEGDHKKSNEYLSLAYRGA